MCVVGEVFFYLFAEDKINRRTAFSSFHPSCANAIAMHKFK